MDSENDFASQDSNLKSIHLHRIRPSALANEHHEKDHLKHSIDNETVIDVSNKWFRRANYWIQITELEAPFMIHFECVFAFDIIATFATWTRVSRISMDFPCFYRSKSSKHKPVVGNRKGKVGELHND